MPTQVQIRRGTTAQNNAFTGAVGEVSADTQVHTLRVHDGSQAGGYELALANLSNATFGSGVATFLATPSSANLAAAVTGETGTGALVFATSPTLVTPALGTPASGVMTNVTGTAASLTAGNVTTNANLTGGVTSVGNAATVVTNANLTGHITSTGNAAILGSFTSAQLSAALSDETGTGVSVFGTSPAITTSLTTGSASFDLINTTATAVNFAKAATTLSIGAGSGTTTINNALTVTGNLTVSGTTTTVDSTTVNVQNAFVFEGTTDDAYETTLTAGEPTADRTITLPDASGTVALTSAFGTGVATWLGTPSSANLATVVTDETGIGSLVFGTNPTITAPTILTGVYFEGATEDAYETLLTVVDPTADNTITLPNVTGTVITTGDTGTVTSTMLAGSIANAKLSNSSTTVGSTAIALGASSTTLAGLTSVTSTGFTGALTGNASTATALATARAINGTNFDGTAAITVTAAAGTLTGATLASGVTASSLTSHGTLVSGAVPASLVTAGTFGAGAYTFPGALAITGALTGATTGAFSSTLAVTGAATFSSTVQTTGLGVGTAPSATAGEIRATNNVTAYYSSDSRLKENVSPIPDALHKIKQLQGVEFDWTQEYITAHGGEDELFMRRHDVGVIAQDVEKVLPEVVATRPDGYLAVRYEKLVPLLLQAIKELSAQVDALSKDR